ncbi:hypothetical protein LC605_08670, partial [Nostoc sp. CHAB 5836]|uniref:hypothetical protein n=1 Tax=Nostoc sp. CHAB 5836 TaxID=2780404 RepID=UPI001E420798
MAFEPKKDAVRRVGFLISYEWFTREAGSTTFVLKHQNEVSSSLSNLSGVLTDVEIREDMIKP